MLTSCAFWAWETNNSRNIVENALIGLADVEEEMEKAEREAGKWKVRKSIKQKLTS